VPRWSRSRQLLAISAIFFAAAAISALIAIAASPRVGVLAEPPAVLVGAGDIALCDSDADSRTAALLDRIEGTVITLGDNAYPDGTVRQFANCYEPTWGRHRTRTRPALGNHEYHTKDATPYFDYFGPSAGERGKGFYSYDVGAWHVIVLNSECGRVACRLGSEQERWLREDLAAHPASCTLAYWHSPLYSSGEHGPDEEVRPLWEALHAAGAEIVLNGHDHHYERFAPLDPKGKPDPERGIRQFIVGTGGGELRRIEKRAPQSEAARSDTYGVLKLTLHRDRYEWEFVPVVGSSFADRGSAACH
jgi:hypothetical protein